MALVAHLGRRTHDEEIFVASGEKDMMKLIVATGLLAISVAGYFAFIDEDDSRPIAAPALSLSPEVEPPAVPLPLPEVKAAQIDSAPTPRSEKPRQPIVVSEKQIRAVQRQQQEIVGMMREYDRLRDDPEVSAVRKAQMQEELKKYSDAVLPVALAKIQEGSVP